uniref:Secreted protein n=1 Tax=Steinernema glaseri TaxID=37863 RepID=A0A1I7YCU0_9BILA
MRVEQYVEYCKMFILFVSMMVWIGHQVHITAKDGVVVMTVQMRSRTDLLLDQSYSFFLFEQSNLIRDYKQVFKFINFHIFNRILAFQHFNTNTGFARKTAPRPMNQHRR